VSFDEHVIRNRAEAELEPPKLRPCTRIVVYSSDERRLRSDNSARRSNPSNRRLSNLGLKLLWMAVMAHDGQLLASVHNLLEKLQELVCVRVSDKTMGPIGRSLRAKTNTSNVFDLEKGLYIPT